jgi:hypothetical protein
MMGRMTEPWQPSVPESAVAIHADAASTNP